MGRRDAVGPAQPIDAFVLTEVGKRSAGSYYHGSLYRGAHDTFLWTTKAKDRGVIRILQDERDYEVRIESCTPGQGLRSVHLVAGRPQEGRPLPVAQAVGDPPSREESSTSRR